jgi:putative ABC transport system permease protein
LAPRRFTARLAGDVALLAVLLALIGVYGVMSYVVAQWTREPGIRIALRAARGEVVRLVLGRGLRVVAAGDVTTLVLVPLVLVSVAAVACWLPARRAARVDPAVALSAE